MYCEIRWESIVAHDQCAWRSDDGRKESKKEKESRKEKKLEQRIKFAMWCWR